MWKRLLGGLQKLYPSLARSLSFCVLFNCSVCVEVGWVCAFLSLLTSSVWVVIIRVYVFHQNIQWLYCVSFMLYHRWSWTHRLFNKALASERELVFILLDPDEMVDTGPTARRFSHSAESDYTNLAEK